MSLDQVGLNNKMLTTSKPHRAFFIFEINVKLEINIKLEVG